jgi:hypothetical protein
MVFTYFSSDIDHDDQIEEDWRDEDDKVDKTELYALVITVACCGDL